LLVEVALALRRVSGLQRRSRGKGSWKAAGMGADPSCALSSPQQRSCRLSWNERKATAVRPSLKPEVAAPFGRE
jgi:hypothetical protein